MKAADWNPLGLAEQFELTVERDGRVVIPREVRLALRLEPGDLLSVLKNPLSLRLNSFRDFLADNWDAVSLPNRWRYLEDFLRHPLASVEPDGSIELPAELVSLSVGDRLVLEVVTRGLSHELFVYRVEG